MHSQLGEFYAWFGGYNELVPINWSGLSTKKHRIWGDVMSFAMDTIDLGESGDGVHDHQILSSVAWRFSGDVPAMFHCRRVCLDRNRWPKIKLCRFFGAILAWTEAIQFHH